MSTRSQVKVISTEFTIPIYLYQHYDGYGLFEIVSNAIKRGKSRWNDPEYLTRIIFSEMLMSGSYDDHNALNDTIGYGIGTSEHGDIDYLVTVNIDDQTIQVNNDPSVTFKEVNSRVF